MGKKTDIKLIIKAIDEFLENKHQATTTPTEINVYLEKMSLLNDSNSRPGKPVREIIRNGQIPHAYQIGVNWVIPHSKKISIRPETITKQIIKKGVKSLDQNRSYSNKLSQIGELIVDLLYKKYKKKASCDYEFSPKWLLTYPQIELINKYPQLIEIHSILTENRLSYFEEYSKLDDKKKIQKQSFDIWIGEPYNFAVEFDEKQHFNQFRNLTLDFYNGIPTKYPLEMYRDLNNGCSIMPGSSGFTRLKSNDTIFPEMFKGAKQDNRIRQRAFRDFLKDLLPLVNGFSPTLRIPYHVTNKKINDFSETDIINVKKYIIQNELI